MRKFVLWLFLVVALPVWALPSPKEVSNAVNTGNYAQAEQLLQQILKEKPNSALAHYELGQVFAKEQRHQEALNELNQAKTLDPSLHFTKKPAVFGEFYNAEVAALQKPVALSAHSSVPPKTQHNSADSSLTGFILSIILVFGVILLIIYFWMRRADAQRKLAQQQRQEEQCQEQLASLLHMADTMRDADLECRAASYSSEQKQLISAALVAHREAVLQAITQCKENHMPLYDEQMQHLQAETARMVQAVRTGSLPPPIAPKVHEPVMAAPQPVVETVATGNAQPIIINNNQSAGSGFGSLAAGVVLGEILAGNHHSEGVVYRDRGDEYSADSSDQLPSFDGSNDDSSTGWDNDDASSDSGNDFDSGNDDSWS